MILLMEGRATASRRAVYLLMEGRATASRRAVYRGRSSRQSQDPPSRKYSETCALALLPVDHGLKLLLPFNSIKRRRFLISYPVNGYLLSEGFFVSFFGVSINFHNFFLTTYS